MRAWSMVALGAIVVSCRAAATPALSDDEWRVKIRATAKCEPDQIHGRAALNGGGAPCAPSRVIGRDVIYDAVLDPLADNSGTTCHYMYCAPITAKRVAPPTCVAPKPRRVTSCFTAPDEGSRIPAAAPYERCPAGIVELFGDLEESFDPEGTKANHAGECCFAFCVAPIDP